MKVVIITSGTRGDVAPFAGLGVRLIAAGHTVAIATQEAFADTVRDAGCEYRWIPGDTRGLLGSEQGREWQEQGTGKLSGMRTNIRLGMRLLEEMGKGVLAAAEGADVLLLQRVAAWHGYVVAKAMGIPGITLELFPSVPTADFALPSFDVRAFGRWGNRNIPRFAMWASSRIKTPLDRPIREFQRQLGVPVSGLGAVKLQMLHDRNWPIYHGYSPAIAPRPADWRPGVEVVGSWWPPYPDGWQPPAELASFLEAGPPPVFVGFGSMTGSAGQRLAETVSAALRQAKVRAVVQAGWSDLAATGDDVITIGDAPHEWLFPRMAAVVHHAGAGTTAAGLRAGSPAIPVPVFGDQPFWSDRLVRLGVSPGWTPMRKLSAERLAALIQQAVTDRSYRQRATAIADRIRKEDGSGQVIQALERIERGRTS
ncbi:glycosyltransferase [Nonomuraea helvata]|uniref:Glycosyltransferase n=1 Tax=Nonomuraea helvata TaxID=37484 RepID=A0ABV5SEG6_9ACTN